MQHKILVVDDETDVLDMLVINLRAAGFQVIAVEDGASALAKARNESPSLIILDLMLPRMPGLEICKVLKSDAATRHIPVIMLTAKAEEVDKIVGLELGADDYVTKPFGVRELLARIQALLRRAPKPISEKAASEAPFQVGPALIDPKTFQIKRGRVTEELTAKELKLLQLFHAHPGEVFSRDRLLNEVWGYNYFGTTRTLDQVIVQLRKKLGDNAGEPKYLLTVHGVGYKLAV